MQLLHLGNHGRGSSTKFQVETERNPFEQSGRTPLRNTLLNAKLLDTRDIGHLPCLLKCAQLLHKLFTQCFWQTQQPVDKAKCQAYLFATVAQVI